LEASAFMKVPRYNYPAQFENSQDLTERLGKMLLAGHYILAEEVTNFENAFAEYLGVKHVRGVNSGTDALTLALRVLGIGRGDEVITQANTFHATVAAIALAGATPVLTDADEHSYLINEAQIACTITSKTRALIAVHLYGKPTPMARILEIAGNSAVALIEDAAQAHGAKLGDKTMGSVGLLGCFSFHPSKNLAAAGDGGAIATDDSGLADRLQQHRALGQASQNHHVVLGYNTKLDAIQAQILHWKLSKLNAWNESRRRVAARYRERLEQLPVSFQSTHPDELHVYHLFTIRTDRRAELLAHLQRLEVDAVVRYPVPIHLQPAFADYHWCPGQFPVAERLAKELLCLPIRPDMTVDEVDYVTDCVRSFFRGRISA
jgi:dTDP-4-amino-4,6-dideoxygalactose transaminase